MRSRLRLVIVAALAALCAGAQEGDGPFVDPEKATWERIRLPFEGTPASDDEIRARVRQLGADTVREREKATTALLRIGPAILPVLAQVKTDDAEILFRVRDILQRFRETREAPLSEFLKRRALTSPTDFAAWLSRWPDPRMQDIILACMGDTVGIDHPLYGSDAFLEFGAGRVLPRLLDLFDRQTGAPYRQRVARMIARACEPGGPGQERPSRDAEMRKRLLALAADKDARVRFWGVRAAAGLRLPIDPETRIPA